MCFSSCPDVLKELGNCGNHVKITRLLYWFRAAYLLNADCCQLRLDREVGVNEDYGAYFRITRNQLVLLIPEQELLVPNGVYCLIRGKRDLTFQTGHDAFGLVQHHGIRTRNPERLNW
jgi:hypothetical protein